MTGTVAPARTGGRNWSRLALTLGQLALMATGLVLSLSLGYAGELSAVGAVAPAMLVFQLTCGVLQRSLAEATLLAEAHDEQAAELTACRRSVAAAFAGGLAGAVLAVASAAVVSGGSIALAIAYAAGIPFALALDIGRAAGVAAGAARAAFVETAIWLVAQLALLVAGAAARSALLVCLSWTVLNAVFFLLSAGRPERRPLFAGLVGWVRSRRNVMGAASLDALLVGSTPLLALQATAFVSDAVTLGVIRITQQLFGPLAFVSITLRRVLVYQRRAGAATSRGQDLRDGVWAAALMAAGATALGLAVLVGQGFVAALSFIPVGWVLVAAGVEKTALGFSYGCSLSRFIRGDFDLLLRARYVMLGLTVLAAPLLTIGMGAPGYLIASAAGMVVYSVVLVARPTRPRPDWTSVPSGTGLS